MSFCYLEGGGDNMEEIRLECLKSILQGHVMLHPWNDEKEDFDILCESTVVDFEKDIPKEFWQKEIYEINPGTVDGESCIIIDLGKRKKKIVIKFDVWGGLNMIYHYSFCD